MGNYQTNTEQRSRISYIPNCSSFERKKFKNEKDFAEDFANAFNQYFTDIGPNLAARIKVPENILYKSYLKRNIDDVFPFKF